MRAHVEGNPTAGSSLDGNTGKWLHGAFEKQSAVVKDEVEQFDRIVSAGRRRDACSHKCSTSCSIKHQANQKRGKTGRLAVPLTRRTSVAFSNALKTKLRH
eukprot:GHVT01051353.1.p2 GENE.GHVT01051353.1~~GHVT01051353.1.p2  ORF type:complete len:101 (-),score=9.74 GHVT01051353.1:130-432(-)